MLDVVFYLVEFCDYLGDFFWVVYYCVFVF